MVSYYGDLSASSSSDDDEEDEEESSISSENENYSDLWSRCIVHLDIDCFYCQCEEIDRDLRKNPRPMAIGQKHIIVTCNYEARSYGVKKLQLREDAMAACPSLWIVEGSDIQNYKRYSRAVYEAFRRALQEIAAEKGIPIPTRKGAMDEMMADLSSVVNQILQDGTETAADSANKDEKNYQTTFVFGESACPTKLVEDQTGQTTVVSFHKNGTAQDSPSRNLPLHRRNVHEEYGIEQDRQTCIRRLSIASMLVARICQSVFNETGFYTTGGISVSPLLAKLASDLNKPKSTNLLYPWRSASLIYSMPLRKMNGVGHGTIRALEGCMETFSTSPSTSQRKDVKTVL
jgi:DNA polymerase iota